MLKTLQCSSLPKKKLRPLCLILNTLICLPLIFLVHFPVSCMSPHIQPCPWKKTVTFYPDSLFTHFECLSHLVLKGPKLVTVGIPTFDYYRLFSSACSNSLYIDFSPLTHIWVFSFVISTMLIVFPA